MGKEAFVTLATNDTYCRSAIVLAQSLRNCCTQKEITILITPQVSPEARAMLDKFFDQIFCVNVLDSKDAANLALLKRPELGITFTKLHCWNLTQYNKCVFMDADTMVLTNIDELFDHQELSAAPDAGWPDMFNSGVFVYEPSYETYMALIQLAEEEGSFDGGDQGLLNTYFNQWRTSDERKRLSFLYNMHSTSTYTYSPAFARFGKDTKVVHFLGQVKPWHHKYSAETDSIQQMDGPGIHEQAFLLQWWRQLTQAMKQFQDSEKTSALPQTFLRPQSPERDPQEVAIEQQVAHHRQWQNAQIDYTGVDSFSNIQQKLDKVLLGDEPEKNEQKSENPAPVQVEQSKGSSTDEVVAADNSPTIVTLSDHQRWKSGAIDYMGQDSFAKIQARLDSVLIGSTNRKTTSEAPSSSNAAPIKVGGASNLNNNNSTLPAVKLKPVVLSPDPVNSFAKLKSRKVKSDDTENLDVSLIEKDVNCETDVVNTSTVAPSIMISTAPRCTIHTPTSSKPSTNSALLTTSKVSNRK
uniref:glycogenin glucosyltransferase n=1 Tax=Phallusia mammillata TaxID=59560 RepID=A0A6F9DE65_9ASCI|nr:glycogenin-1 [Phallusia mammillata]